MNEECDGQLDLTELIAALDPRCESCRRRGVELIEVDLGASKPFQVCHPCDLSRRG